MDGMLYMNQMSDPCNLRIAVINMGKKILPALYKS